jgi:hypothetical protein
MILRKLGIRSRLRAGDLVEVRSKEEILATLDSNGRLDGMPFMPEMLQYCGRRFKVYKRAHKTCDTVFPIRGRRMSRAVHLETRCSGEAHGGCQAGCLIFWKTDWLKRVRADEKPSENIQLVKLQRGTAGACTEKRVWDCTQVDANDPQPTYICQATQVPYATTDLRWWDIRQYIEDYTSGNVGLRTILIAVTNNVVFRLSKLRGIGWRVRRIYEHTAPRLGAPKWPKLRGSIEIGKPTPTSSLNLHPGELVRVKPHETIIATVNRGNHNRGMSFDKEMVPFCEGEYKVLKRVTKIINERTGKMQEMKTPSIILDDVFCQSRYSECRLFCPRSIYSFWREIWLERVPESKPVASGQPESPVECDLSKPVWQLNSEIISDQRREPQEIR